MKKTSKTRWDAIEFFSIAFLFHNILLILFGKLVMNPFSLYFHIICWRRTFPSNQCVDIDMHLRVTLFPKDIAFFHIFLSSFSKLPPKLKKRKQIFLYEKNRRKNSIFLFRFQLNYFDFFFKAKKRQY